MQLWHDGRKLRRLDRNNVNTPLEPQTGTRSMHITHSASRTYIGEGKGRLLQITTRVAFRHQILPPILADG